jgi:hypothetical protein
VVLGSNVQTGSALQSAPNAECQLVDIAGAKPNDGYCGFLLLRHCFNLLIDAAPLSCAALIFKLRYKPQLR